MIVRASAVAVLILLVLNACSSSRPHTASSTTTTAVPPPTTIDAADSTTTTVQTAGVAPSGLRTRVQDVLMVGTERLAPPWFIGPSADLVSGGFEYDVAAELARRLGVPSVRVVPASLVWMMGGQDCSCDVMLSGITITDARARTLDLSEPYLSADQGVLVRKGTVVTTPAEAAALRWGVALRDSAGVDLLQARVKPTLAPDVVVNDDEAIQRLVDGRDDAVLMDTPDAIAVANADPTLALAGQFKTGEQYSVALGLGSPNTALINDAIRNMRDDGTIDTLLRAYFGLDPAKLPSLSS